MRAFLPEMMKLPRANIINIVSLTSYVGVGGMGDYCSSKAAARIWSEAIRMELLSEGVKGIKIATINPWIINTGMFDGVLLPPLLSLLASPLSEKHVVASILDAVCFDTNQDVELPGFFSWVSPLVRLLPVPLFVWLREITAADKAMSGWKGRGTNWAMQSVSKIQDVGKKSN